MDTLETLLKKIRPRPELYIGELDIDRLYAFLSGYANAAKQADPEFDDRIWYGFNQYLADKFQDMRSVNWSWMIREHCPEEDKVKAFFELLDEYRQDEISVVVDRLFYKTLFYNHLIPVVVQDVDSREVLMVGFTNREAVKLTLKTKTAWFWSRSRKKLWNKGESSGNYLHVQRILTDCDTDTLLYLCKPDGPTCHTGAVSCFFREIEL